MNEITELLRQSVADTKRRQAEALRDEYLKVYANLYERATAYTRGVIAVTYATAFGVWAFLGDGWSAVLQAIAGLLLLLSAAVFALWEVYANIRGALHLRSFAKLLQAPPDQAAEKLHDYLQARNEEAAKLGGLWASTVLVCLLTGLTALGIMTWAIAQTLLPSVSQWLR